MQRRCSDAGKRCCCQWTQPATCLLHLLQGSPEERRQAAKVNKKAMVDRAQKVPGVSRDQADQVELQQLCPRSQDLNLEPSGCSTLLQCVNVSTLQ